MELALKLLTVLGLGAVELWAAIPAGLALGLHPAAVGLAAGAGQLAVAAAILLIGEKARAWVMRRLGREQAAKPDSLAQRIWNRFGVPGLGLLAPVAVGVALGLALGLTFGAPVRRLTIWFVAGIVFWCAVLTAAGALGLAGLQSLTQ